MGDTYNVFISWSGERSRMVAAALYDWLPMVVQSAKPWMSEEDIEKGSRGLVEIGKALEVMGVGIICLTPENLERPWILFEAGALSKTLDDKTRVCPYLFGDLRPENVRAPLGMFQATTAEKKETRRLVGTINRALGGSLAEERLDTVFERMWPELDGKLSAVPAATGAKAPERTEREMMAEMLELVRAGAGTAEGMKAIQEDVRLVGDIVSKLHKRIWMFPRRMSVAEGLAGARGTLSEMSGSGAGGAESRSAMSAAIEGLAGGRGTLAQMATDEALRHQLEAMGIDVAALTKGGAGKKDDEKK